MNKKNYTFVIGHDSCNGEEAQFLNWMKNNYPNIDSSIECTMLTGLFLDGELVEYDNYWDEYCES